MTSGLSKEDGAVWMMQYFNTAAKYFYQILFSFSPEA